MQGPWRIENTCCEAIWRYLSEVGRPATPAELLREIKGWSSQNVYMAIYKLMSHELLVLFGYHTGRNQLYSLPPIAHHPRPWTSRIKPVRRPDRRERPVATSA